MTARYLQTAGYKYNYTQIVSEYKAYTRCR